MQRDWALDNANFAALDEVHRAAELWHRAPEEWELERVETGPAWMRITYAQLARGGWIEVLGQRISMDAVWRAGWRTRHVNSFEAVEQLFRERGIEVRHCVAEAALDVRPMPFQFRNGPESYRPWAGNVSPPHRPFSLETLGRALDGLRRR